MTSNTSGTISRIKIAVCGEASSGKTSFLNSLRRGDALPDFSRAKTKPVMTIVFGADADAIFYMAGDEKQTARTLNDVPTDGRVTALEVHSTSNALGNCEVIEFPPLRDGHVTKGEIEAISECDILVWMTIGSQAWRLSEKTIIGKIPNRTAEQSVLVVSRADKFRSSADQDRLATRLEEETSDYFDAGAMMCADPKTLTQAQHDDAAWEKVGGKAHTELLAALVAKAEADKPLPKIDALPKSEALQPTRETSHMKRPRRSRSRRLSKLGSNPAAPLTETDEVFNTPAPKVETVNAPQSPVVAADVAPSLEEINEVQAEGTASTTQFEEMKAIAEGLDGFIALTSFKTNAPEKANVICGDAPKAKEFAKHFAQGAEFLVKDPFFEDPEWVHISAQGHQILYRLEPAKNETLLLACRSSNPGIARNAFIRISDL